MAALVAISTIGAAAGAVASSIIRARIRPGRCPCAAQVFDQLLRNLFEKARRNALLRRVIAVAAAEVGAGEDQGVHGPSHAYVTEAPLLFQFLRIVQSARVGE